MKLQFCKDVSFSHIPLLFVFPLQNKQLFKALWKGFQILHMHTLPISLEHIEKGFVCVDTVSPFAHVDEGVTVIDREASSCHRTML